MSDLLEGFEELIDEAELSSGSKVMMPVHEARQILVLARAGVRPAPCYQACEANAQEAVRYEYFNEHFGRWFPCENEKEADRQKEVGRKTRALYARPIPAQSQAVANACAECGADDPCLALYCVSCIGALSEQSPAEEDKRGPILKAKWLRTQIDYIIPVWSKSYPNGGAESVPVQQSPAVDVPADCLSPTVRSSRRYGEPTARHIQSPAVTAPDGWKLVPTELTQAMLFAANSVHIKCGNDVDGDPVFTQVNTVEAEQLFNAFLLAAPTPPKSPRITEPAIPKGFVLWPENLTFDMVTAYESAILGPISTFSGEGYLRMLNVVKSQFNNALRSASSQCSLRITEQDAYDIILNFYWYMEEFKNKHGRNPSLIEWRDAGGRALLNNLNNGEKQ